MDRPNAPLDFHRAAVDALGGVPLEGSGFENETPEREFQFDWTLLKDQSEGGLQ